LRGDQSAEVASDLRKARREAFAGRWWIVETDVWDNEFHALVEQAHITFSGSEDGEIRIAWLTVQFSRSSDGR
jgi:hypothetical protein